MSAQFPNLNQQQQNLPKFHHDFIFKIIFSSCVIVIFKKYLWTAQSPSFACQPDEWMDAEDLGKPGDTELKRAIPSSWVPVTRLSMEVARGSRLANPTWCWTLPWVCPSWSWAPLRWRWRLLFLFPQDPDSAPGKCSLTGHHEASHTSTSPVGWGRAGTCSLELGML